MISKQDILDRASEWRLRPDVLEKDYVLAWLLAGLGQHPVVRNLWVFKGGTCIKKCYLETYRFSEDLDFSLLPAAPYSAEEIRHILSEVAKAVTEMSGILFPEEFIEVRKRHNKQGQPTFQGKLSYGGPLRQWNSPTPPRVLFDLTRYEPVLDTPQPRRTFHPYPDALPEEASILAYSLDELLAEKTRALYERTRPRDVYDVVYILDNPPQFLHLDRTRELFKRLWRLPLAGLASPRSCYRPSIIGAEGFRWRPSVLQAPTASWWNSPTMGNSASLSLTRSGAPLQATCCSTRGNWPRSRSRLSRLPKCRASHQPTLLSRRASKSS